MINRNRLIMIDRNVPKKDLGTFYLNCAMIVIDLDEYVSQLRIRVGGVKQPHAVWHFYVRERSRKREMQITNSGDCSFRFRGTASASIHAVHNSRSARKACPLFLAFHFHSPVNLTGNNYRTTLVLFDKKPESLIKTKAV